MFVWNVCTTDRIKLIWTLILKISDKLLALPSHCNINLSSLSPTNCAFKTVFIRVIYAKPTSNSHWDSPLNRHVQVIRLQQQACKLITAQFFLLLSLRWYLVCLKHTQHKPALWYRNIQKSWTLQVFSFSQMRVTDHLQSCMNFIVCIQIHSNS